jgi:hypothetical protein
MARPKALVGSIAASVVAAYAWVAVAQQGSRPEEAPSWLALTRPGEPHRRLDPLVGTWDLSVGPENAAGGEDSTGTATFRWILGDRFLVEEVSTNLGGAPFEWMGIHGYDNAKKRYVSSWVDNLGTGIDSMTGSFEDATKTLGYEGELDEGDGTTVKVRWRVRLESADRFSVTMTSVAADGTETTQLELVGRKRP